MTEEVAAALSGNVQHRYEVLIRFSCLVTQFKRILIGEICTDVPHIIHVTLAKTQFVDESYVTLLMISYFLEAARTFPPEVFLFHFAASNREDERTCSGTCSVLQVRDNSPHVPITLVSSHDDGLYHPEHHQPLRLCREQKEKTITLSHRLQSSIRVSDSYKDF